MLTSVADHYFQNRVTYCTFLAGCLFWLLVPYLHLGVIYSFWTPKGTKPEVDRDTCVNTCWDTIFKGSYQFQIATGYKHVYFNITSNSFKIWTITLLFILGIYESFRYLLSLFFQRSLRVPMVVLFCTVIYPHYYAWWGYFGYYNDEYYIQWNHQTFFTLTELVSTFMVIHLCDVNKETTPRKLLVIMCIAVVHILASGVDQFVVNIFMRQGYWHQAIRDLGFMVPDLLHLFVAMNYLIKARGSSGLSVFSVGIFCISTLILSTICYNL